MGYSLGSFRAVFLDDLGRHNDELSPALFFMAADLDRLSDEDGGAETGFHLAGISGDAAGQK